MYHHLLMIQKKLVVTQHLSNNLLRTTILIFYTHIFDYDLLRVSIPGVSHQFRMMTGAETVGIIFWVPTLRIIEWKFLPGNSWRARTIRYRKIIIFLCWQIDIQVRIQSNIWCGSCSPIQRGKGSVDCFKMCLSEVMLDGQIIMNCVDDKWPFPRQWFSRLRFDIQQSWIGDIH
jgi:hypothetical protein